MTESQNRKDFLLRHYEQSEVIHDTKTPRGIQSVDLQVWANAVHSHNDKITRKGN